MPKIFVLSADKFKIEGEAGRPGMEGVSMHFVNEYREDSVESRGHKPSKISVGMGLAPAVLSANLPAVCEVDFASRPGAQGKATLALTSFRVLASVPLEKILSAVAPQPAAR